MTTYVFRLFDKITREEVHASAGVQSENIPEINRLIFDPELMRRYCGPALVDAVSASPYYDPASDIVQVDVTIRGVAELLNNEQETG
jgi:hypothetical protein